MSTLYVDRRDVELRADGNAVAIYADGGKRGTVPMNLLERVVLRAHAQLDTRLLGALSEHGVGLLVLSPRHGRRLALLAGVPHNDVRRRWGQYLAYAQAAKRCAWSRMLVLAKLRAQVRLLERARGARLDLRKPLSDGIGRIERAIDTLGAYPMERLTLGTARGIEGAAAAAYFAAYTRLFAGALEFHGRNRRPPRDPVNACLSLAYTLLHAEAVQCTYAAGLDPFLGLYHEPAFGRESLATDVIEPLRPHVDEWVWKLMRERTLSAEHFRRDKGACLLGKTGRAHFYDAYESLAKPLRRLLRREMPRVAKGFVTPDLPNFPGVRG